MLGTLLLALAIGVATVTSSHAQTSGTLRPGTATTGIGGSSTSKSVPRPELPVRGRSGPAIAGSDPGTPAKENGERESKAPGNTAPPPPPADVEEDPRTMITRDRIESPQH
jgi:hypothetical protein